MSGRRTLILGGAIIAGFGAMGLLLLSVVDAMTSPTAATEVTKSSERASAAAPASLPSYEGIGRCVEVGDLKFSGQFLSGYLYNRCKVETIKGGKVDVQIATRTFVDGSVSIYVPVLLPDQMSLISENTSVYGSSSSEPKVITIFAY